MRLLFVKSQCCCTTKILRTQLALGTNFFVNWFYMGVHSRCICKFLTAYFACKSILLLWNKPENIKTRACETFNNKWQPVHSLIRGSGNLSWLSRMCMGHVIFECTTAGQLLSTHLTNEGCIMTLFVIPQIALGRTRFSTGIIFKISVKYNFKITINRMVSCNVLDAPFTLQRYPYPVFRLGRTFFG